MDSKLPADFDPETYLRINQDVAAAGVDAADHWLKYGQAEGRRYQSDVRFRAGVAERALRTSSQLEIGPFSNPALSGPHVSYFDVLDKNALIERAKSINYPYENAKEIDFVSPTGDLSIVNKTFDSVLSAHCIEHQPDLIAHLQNVSRILNPGGVYYLIIPDKRYCFDATVNISTIAEIISAHVEGRKVHSLTSVIEHYALTTHNDPIRHWNGLHTDNGHSEGILERIRQSLSAWKGAAGGYVDVHAWQFTPESFAQNLNWLKALEFVDLDIEFVNETPRDHSEFTAALKKVINNQTKKAPQV